MRIKTEFISRNYYGYKHIMITPVVEFTYEEDYYEENTDKEVAIGFSWLHMSLWIVITY